MTSTATTTGIVRRIDDLGRINIPREVRRSLNINEGDPFEIFTTSNGELVLKQYFEKSKDLNALLEEFEKLTADNQAEFTRKIFEKFIKKA